MSDHLDCVDQERRSLCSQCDVLEEELFTLRAELAALVGRNEELKEQRSTNVVRAEQKGLGQAIQDVNTLIAERKHELRTALDRLSQLNGSSIDYRVTQHAMLRYLQRVRGLDVLRLEHEICDYFGHDGSAVDGVITHDGFQAVVRGGRIITVMPAGDETREPPLRLRLVKSA